MKFIRALIGLLLIPVCIALSQALFDSMRVLWPGSLSAVSPSAMALGIGIALWLAVYLGLPRPVRTYVLAHELTHALWGWLMGAKVHGIRFSKEGGVTRLSRTNAMISLAPYFFPLYTFIVITGFGIASFFADVRPYVLYWLMLVGFSWGFHVTFTFSALSRPQSDIEEFGRLFSCTVIYLFNIAGGAAWLIIGSRLTCAQFLSAFWGRFAGFWAGVCGLATRLASLVQ